MSVTGLEDVTVQHADGSCALRRVTLRAQAGELLVVLGASGSGKSTMLRAIAGLAPVHGGKVLIDGRVVNKIPVPERNVAMVFETSALVPFLDVASNMSWGLRARKTPEPEVRRRVEDSAKTLRFFGLLARKPQTLSAGEREMVGIGRALVRDPSVFLLDEPLAHLDLEQRPRVRRQIADAVRKAGVTTIYVTHDQTDAMAIADRVALLHAGSIEQIAAPRVMYARPDNLVVATFVGSPQIGLLPARLVASGGMAGFAVGARTLPLWEPVPPDLVPLVGSDVVLGLRWHDVHDADTVPDPELGTLLATVVRVERTGRDAIVTAEAAAPAVRTPGASQPGDAQARIFAQFPAATKVREGDRVTLAIDVRRAHVFDSRTGRALLHPPD